VSDGNQTDVARFHSKNKADSDNFWLTGQQKAGAMCGAGLNRINLGENSPEKPYFVASFR
jgi:hypothetical protein